MFAIDVKDAQEPSLTSDFDECDDAWYLGANDLWRRLIHYRQEETGTTLLEARSAEDLADLVIEDLQNYRMFRYLNTLPPSSPEEALKFVRGMSYFPPTHIWLSGKFFDFDDITRVSSNAQAPASPSQDSTVVPSSSKRMVISTITINISS